MRHCLHPEEACVLRQTKCHAGPCTAFDCFFRYLWVDALCNCRDLVVICPNSSSAKVIIANAVSDRDMFERIEEQPMLVPRLIRAQLKCAFLPHRLGSSALCPPLTKSTRGHGLRAYSP